ncbi:hypothetical protein TNCV_1888961 [Trichonephila clavipes]|nr:hypothetical protein TNCV_1888961 [Trichonephila clavipes]
MVEVKPINISLDQHSPGISVRTAISPTLTEEFIIHPSVYSEIEKLGHAKSDVLLNESESSLGAHAYAYPNVVSFSNVPVSSVIENSSYDLPHVKNFNTRNDLSSLIKDYKYSPLVSMEVPLRTAYGQNGRCSMQPKPSSLRAQAQLKHELKLELVEEKQKLLDIREKGERERCASRRYLLHIIVKLIYLFN